MMAFVQSPTTCDIQINFDIQIHLCFYLGSHGHSRDDDDDDDDYDDEPFDLPSATGQHTIMLLCINIGTVFSIRYIYFHQRSN